MPNDTGARGCGELKRGAGQGIYEILQSRLLDSAVPTGALLYAAERYGKG